PSVLLKDSKDLRVESVGGLSPDGRFMFAKTAHGVTVWDVSALKARTDEVPRTMSDRPACLPLGIANDGQRLAWYCAEKDMVSISRDGQQPPVTTPVTTPVTGKKRA